jgi:hypothetical protein
LLVTTTAATTGDYEFSWLFEGFEGEFASEFAFFVTMQEGYNGDPDDYPDPLTDNVEFSDLLAASGTTTVALTAGTIFGFAVLNNYNLEGDFTVPHLVVYDLNPPA